MFKSLWVQLAASVLSAFVQAMTPALRELLREFVLDLYGKAKRTSNPYDDLAVAGLLAVLGIETPPEV